MHEGGAAGIEEVHSGGAAGRDVFGVFIAARPGFPHIGLSRILFGGSTVL